MVLNHADARPGSLHEESYDVPHLFPLDDGAPKDFFFEVGDPL